MSTLTASEQDALVRFRAGGRGPHLERHYLHVHVAPGQALWVQLSMLRRTVGQQADYCEAWAIWQGPPSDGLVAIKRSRPGSEARLEEGSVYVKLDEVEWRLGGTRGVLEDERTGRRLAWELSYPTFPDSQELAPRVVSPQIDARASGFVEVEGQRLEVASAPAMLGHQWGKDAPAEWVHVHVNAWDDAERLILEGRSAPGKLGLLRAGTRVSLHARVGGERLDMRGRGAKGGRDGLSWAFSGTDGDRRIEGQVSATPERMAGWNLQVPDGRLTHVLHSLTADATLRVLGKEGGGWRVLSEGRASGTAALEIGTRGPTLGVPIVLR